MVLATVLAALSLFGANPTDTVLLGSHGRAVVGAQGVTVNLHGLKPGGLVNVLLKAGTCRRPSASFASIISRRATDAGTLNAFGRPRFRGELVSHSLVADGDHLIVVVQGGRVVGCGAIPGMS